MVEFIANIPGKHTLPEINLMINGVEATGAELTAVHISFHDGTITNLATFDRLSPDDTLPKPIVLSTGGATASDGMILVWAGVMLVSGKNTAVTAFRHK